MTAEELVEHIDATKKIPPGLMEIGIEIVELAIELLQRRRALRHIVTAMQLRLQLLEEQVGVLKKNLQLRPSGQNGYCQGDTVISSVWDKKTEQIKKLKDA